MLAPSINGLAAPSLTLSRQLGARGLSMAIQLAAYLERHDELGQRWEVLQCRSGRLSPLTRHPESLSHDDLRPEITETDLLAEFVPAVRSLCENGRVLLVDGCTALITADVPTTFHVRLVGSEASRLYWLGQRHQLDSEQARSWIEQHDETEYAIASLLELPDPTLPSHYHMILNTDRLTETLIVKLIGDSLLEWNNDVQRLHSNALRL